MDTVSMLLRLPAPLRDALTARARRERRSRAAEVLVLLEWALTHMPEHLAERDDSTT
jgi:hypothetical protein